MILTRSPTAVLGSLVSLTATLAAAGTTGAQQEPASARFGEIVEVQLVNVEAWVTDARGNPVLGLAAEDFEVLEDGRPVEITHFAEIGAEQLRAIAATPPREEKIPPPFTLEPPVESPHVSPAYLVLYFDQIHLTTASRKRLIKDFRPFLDSGLVHPERVLILRQEANLYTEANLGSDRIELEQALYRIVRSGNAGTLTEHEKRLAVARLQQLWEEIRNSPSLASDPCDLFVPRARPEVETYAQMVVNRIQTTLQHLNDVASFLGGVPGVKTLIYVADSLEMTPGRDVLRVVQELCPGRPETQAYNLPDSLNKPFRAMTRSANANRVTFYAMQPSGLRADFLTTAGTRAGDFRTRTSLITAAMRESERSGMSFVAGETGGRAVFNTNSFADDFMHVGQDMTSFYSLAYTPPHGGDRGDHEIEVRIKDGRNLKVRHRRGYRDKGPQERLDDRLYSSLFLGLSDNPLRARLGAGAMRQVDGKRFSIPLHVLIPAERMAFMPQQDGALAGITVELAAKDPERAKIFRSRSSFEIDQPAEGENVSIDLVVTLELERGKYVLAVAVRDEASQETSYVSTAFEVAPPAPPGTSP